MAEDVERTGRQDVCGEPHRALRADAVRNRARIMEAAWRLLAQYELVDLNMEQVAREADIGKATLYRHYPTKESRMRQDSEHNHAVGRVSLRAADLILPYAACSTAHTSPHRS